MARKQSKLSKPKDLWLSKWKAVLLVLIFAGALLVFLEFTNTTHLLHKMPSVSGSIPIISINSSQQKSAFKPSSTNSSTSSPKTTPGDSNSNKPTPVASGASGTQSGDLMAPFGSFISNRTPRLSSSDEQQTEQSVCNTTPGASCYIRFTKVSIVKTLPSQLVDPSGSVIWNWKLKDSGINEGTWIVEAVSTLNNLSKTVQGPKLEVSP